MLFMQNTTTINLMQNTNNVPLFTETKLKKAKL